MKNNKVQAVVVGGFYDSNGQQAMITLLGAFENVSEAYGEAYLYLEELARQEVSDHGNVKISLALELEGETGYAMYVLDKDDKPLDYAYILFNDNYEGESHEK